MLKKSSKAIVDEALKEISTLGLKEVKTLIDEKACTLVDLRDIREIYNEGGIADALHIPRGFLEFWVDPESPYYQKDRFDDNKKILLFCAMGQRSALYRECRDSNLFGGYCRHVLESDSSRFAMASGGV